MQVIAGRDGDDKSCVFTLASKCAFSRKRKRGESGQVFLGVQADICSKIIVMDSSCHHLIAL